MKKIFLLLLFSLLILPAVFALNQGDPAGTFVNPDLSGKFIFSKDSIGKGWVLLDFFATWCNPCREELPELEQLYAEFSGKGLKAFLFATDPEGADIVNPFFAERPTAMTVLIDKYMVTAKRYRVEGLPAVFLIDPDGNIRIRGDGYSPDTIDEMRTLLGEAFGK